MITLNWIVCERSNRWAPSLRTALARQTGPATVPARLHEVRNLNELMAQIRECANCLALVEVTPENLDATLKWLADTVRGNALAKAVGLLDHSFGDETVSAGDSNAIRRAEVASALREAGATEIVESPRRIQHILRMGAAYAAKRTRDVSRQPKTDQPIADWAWELLPWQDARRPVG